jgi:hypothetical protein
MFRASILLKARATGKLDAAPVPWMAASRADLDEFLGIDAMAFGLTIEL